MGENKGVYYDFGAWGKAIWTHMHVYTFGYPLKPTAEDQARAKLFFSIIPYTLPCGVCGLHFVKLLNRHPLTQEVLSSKITLSQWLVDRHNEVNQKLKKPTLTFDQVAEIYLNSGFGSTTDLDNKTNINNHNPVPLSLLTSFQNEKGQMTAGGKFMVATIIILACALIGCILLLLRQHFTNK